MVMILLKIPKDELDRPIYEKRLYIEFQENMLITAAATVYKDKKSEKNVCEEMADRSKLFGGMC